MECLNCKNETTNPKFCCKSCAVKYNNSQRKLNDNTKEKIAKSLSKEFDMKKLLDLIDEFSSVKRIANELNLGETTIRRILKQNNLTLRKKQKVEIEKRAYTKSTKPKNKLSGNTHCPIHNVLLKESSGKVYCNICVNRSVKQLRTNIKIEAVIYKGGKCERCSYDNCLSALEFHHLDPLEKDFSVSDFNSSNIDELKPELDKCILVCSNCHREIHSEMRNDDSAFNWKENLGE